LFRLRRCHRCCRRRLGRESVGMECRLGLGSCLGLERWLGLGPCLGLERRLGLEQQLGVGSWCRLVGPRLGSGSGLEQWLLLGRRLGAAGGGPFLALSAEALESAVERHAGAVPAAWGVGLQRAEQRGRCRARQRGGTASELPEPQGDRRRCRRAGGATTIAAGSLIGRARNGAGVAYRASTGAVAGEKAGRPRAQGVGAGAASKGAAAICAPRSARTASGCFTTVRTAPRGCTGSGCTTGGRVWRRPPTLVNHQVARWRRV